MESSCNEGALKYRPRLGYYKINTGNCTLTIENGNFRAKSYNWWSFVFVMDGILVFNDYGYSNSTSMHQSEVQRVLKELGQPIDVTIRSKETVNSPIELRKYLVELWEEYYGRQAQAELRKRGKLPFRWPTDEIKSIQAIGMRLTKREHFELKYAAEFGEVERECEIKANAKKGRENAKIGEHSPAAVIRRFKEGLLNNSWKNV